MTFSKRLGNRPYQIAGRRLVEGRSHFVVVLFNQRIAFTLRRLAISRHSRAWSTRFVILRSYCRGKPRKTLRSHRRQGQTSRLLSNTPEKIAEPSRPLVDHSYSPSVKVRLRLPHEARQMRQVSVYILAFASLLALAAYYPLLAEIEVGGSVMSTPAPTIRPSSAYRASLRSTTLAALMSVAKSRTLSTF